jgi:hypothetical protein
MSEDQARRFADKSARAAREAVDRGSAAAHESAEGAEQSYFAAADGIRDFNVRLIEMVHANTLAALALVREISTAKGPSEAASLWSSHAQRQFETLTEQSKELTALAQRIATSSAEPIARSFGNALKGTSRAFPKFESYGVSETAAFRGWKAQDATEWFHGIGRLVDRPRPARCLSRR